MKFAKSKTISFIEIILLGLLIFIPLIGIEPRIEAGKHGYLVFSDWRPPLYTSFLWLFHFFGKYQYHLAMWVQSTLVFITLLYAKNWLNQFLGIPKWICFFIVVITCAINFTYSHMLQILYSESLAFSLFVINFLLLVENFKQIQLKKMVILGITISLLILTREQFYFMYVLALLIPLWNIWKKQINRKTFLSLLIVIISMLSTSAINRGYHYLLTGHFRDSGYIGQMLIVQPLYLADSKSATYFKNPTEKKVFEQMITVLENKQLTRKSAPPSVHTQHIRIAYDYFVGIFNEIDQTFGQIFPADLSSYEINDITLNISKTLFLINIKENLGFYLWKFAAYCGGGSPWIFLSFLLPLIVITFRTLLDRKWNPDSTQIFIAISLVFILGNAAFVALFQTYSPRYFYYSYFLYFSLGGLLAKEFSKKSIEQVVTK